MFIVLHVPGLCLPYMCHHSTALIFMSVSRGSGLFNDPVTNIECFAFNDRSLVNNELERMGKQAVMA